MRYVGHSSLLKQKIYYRPVSAEVHFNSSQFFISCAQITVNLQTPCGQPCNNHLASCSLPDSKPSHQENLQRSKAASWTHETWLVLSYRKRIRTPIALNPASPVAGNLLCVATGETVSYNAICVGIYTIYTPPGRWHPKRLNSFQAAVVSLVLRRFLSFRTCFVLKKELKKFSYITSFLYLAL